jgi:dUTPase
MPILMPDGGYSLSVPERVLLQPNCVNEVNTKIEIKIPNRTILVISPINNAKNNKVIKIYNNFIASYTGELIIDVGVVGDTTILLKPENPFAMMYFVPLAEV